MSARPSRAEAPGPAPLLSIRGAKKAFGSTLALDGVTIEARAGEVHAILGENGAGKSTLMNVLGGSLSLDAGTIELGGRAFAPRNPRQARDAGIAMVHQELSLCAHLTVAQNIVLGREPTRLGMIQRSVVRERAVRALAIAAGANAPSPDALVGDLAPAERQLVEIARALADDGCRVLLLDEPTSSLGQDDVERLFDRIRALRQTGLLVLYISHFLPEIEKVADRFTVLRDGRTVGAGVVRDTPMTDVVTLMAGRAAGRTVETAAPRVAQRSEAVALAVRALAGQKRPVSASFELHRGEVLGIAGLVGSGRTELLRAIFGLDPVASGSVEVGADAGVGSPARRLRQGVGMLSEDRKGEGLFLALSVADNLTISRLAGFGRAGLVFASRQRHAAREWVSRLGVRCRDVGQPVGDLSGGNQQKVAIGRLLHHDVNVLLLDQPTRGIDVVAKAEVHAAIRDLAGRGKAIVLVSDDLAELLGACDRIAVMHRGVLGAARATSEWTQATLLAEAVGAVA
jgi:ribose transport system ATP-binding protein